MLSFLIKEFEKTYKRDITLLKSDVKMNYIWKLFFLFIIGKIEVNVSLI